MAVFEVNFMSYTLRRDILMNIVVPTVDVGEILFQGGIPEHKIEAKFPVLYLLHGMMCDHRAWCSNSSIERLAQEKGMVVVMPGMENKWYIDWKSVYPRLTSCEYFTLLDQEIQEFVKAYFPVSDQREDTYIAGYSMGGFGAMLHGFTNPEKYRAIGVFSPRVTMDTSKYGTIGTGSDKPMFPDDLSKEVRERWEPTVLLRKSLEQGKRIPDIYLASGENDFMHESQIDLRNAICDTGIALTWDELPDYGHEWDFWEIEIRKFMEWIPRTDFYSIRNQQKGRSDE